LEAYEPVLQGPFLGTDTLLGQRHRSEGKEKEDRLFPSTKNVMRGRGIERLPRQIRRENL
jgi:hypothetical protein